MTATLPASPPDPETEGALAVIRRCMPRKVLLEFARRLADLERRRGSGRLGVDLNMRDGKVRAGDVLPQAPLYVLDD